jgi:Ca2+-binding EF-hand superfamily protein
MKARIVSTAIVCTLGWVCGLAQAQEAGGTNQRLQRLMERFHTADLNNDGHLTREEAQKGMPRVYEHFSEIDTDNKGYVTLEQITAYLEAHPGPRARNAPPAGAPPPQ